MPPSSLLKELAEQTTNELLKALIGAYESDVAASREQNVATLVATLEDKFKGQLDEADSR